MYVKTISGENDSRVLPSIIHFHSRIAFRLDLSFHLARLFGRISDDRLLRAFDIFYKNLLTQRYKILIVDKCDNIILVAHKVINFCTYIVIDFFKRESLFNVADLNLLRLLIVITTYSLLTCR